MNKHSYSERLMVKCAKLYYEENLNQAQISESLQISKSTVSRIISAAREEGIVKIIIENPSKDDYIEIEKKLEKKFGLLEVIIVDSSNDVNETKRNLGKATADYLKRVIRDGQIIGVTMGTTLREVAQFIRNDKRNRVTFIPMLGGVGETAIDIHSNQIVIEMARKFNADYKLLHAPSIIDDLERKEIFIQDKSIQNFYELFNKMDIGVIGIGDPLLNTSTLLESGYYTINDLKRLKDEGAVADISLLFIDKDGNGDKFDFNKRVIGISLNQIKKIPLPIGIGGPIDKKDAILATLKGKYIKVLIVDFETSKALLDEEFSIN
jgi:DNA-binding transcriptional regulator LsrR (DeoR family)